MRLCTALFWLAVGGASLLFSCESGEHLKREGAPEACDPERCQLIGVYAKQLDEVPLLSYASEDCENREDDDDDGFIDCDDASCWAATSCTPAEEAPPSACVHIARSPGSHHTSKACREVKSRKRTKQRALAARDPFMGLFSDNPGEVLESIKPHAKISKESWDNQHPLYNKSGDILGPGEEELHLFADIFNSPKKEAIFKATIIEKEESANIGEKLERSQQRLQSCYERELTNNERLQGSLSLDFVLSESGKVGQIEITEDTLKSKSVSTCIKGVLRRIKFPKSEQESTVSASFVFSKP